MSEEIWMAGIDPSKIEGRIELLDERMNNYQFMLEGQASYFDSEEVGIVYGHGAISLSDRWLRFLQTPADHSLAVSWQYETASDVTPKTTMAFKLVRKASQKTLNLDVYFSGECSYKPRLIDGLLPPVRSTLIELLNPSYVHTTNMYEKEPYFRMEEGVVVRDRRPWWDAPKQECEQDAPSNGG
jgi:hypothetical protein